MTSSSKPGKALRIGLAVDGKLADQLHQAEPGDVTVGRALSSTLVVSDVERPPPDYRRRAPMWLALGLLISLFGATVFGRAVADEAAVAAERDAAGEQLRAFVLERELTWGDLAFAMIFVGLVPGMVGLIGLWEPRRPAPAQPSSPCTTLPHKHVLFRYADGQYHLDAPPEVTGKLRLGAAAVTLTKLRKRLGTDRVQLALPSSARGKLLIGEHVLLFQLAAPARPKVVPALPAELRSPLGLLKLQPLDLQAYAAALVLVGGYVIWQGVLVPPRPAASIDERMISVMGITYEAETEKPPEEPEEEVEEVLAQKDDEKKEEVEDDTEILKEKPQEFSKKAVEKARGVGIARVLGTYGGPGEGSVFDVISSTENNLGELFAMGMTQTVMADGGEISPFVAGGEGITAHGAMAANEGLATAEGPEVEGGGKRERKIKGQLKSSTTDIFGDVDKTAVKTTIRRRMSALQHCYEKALRSSPGLKGKITYTITVSTMGRVSAVMIEEDTLGNPAVRDCTKAKIKGWRFPSEGAQESSEVTFNVVFSGAS